MPLVLAVALGGASGAVLRYVMTEAIHQSLGREFAYGTLSVNVIGSLFVGALYVFFVEQAGGNLPWRMALTVGLLGAFTTFSTFSLETVQYLLNGDVLKAGMNTIANVVLCLVATYLGLSLTRWMI